MRLAVNMALRKFTAILIVQIAIHGMHAMTALHHLAAVVQIPTMRMTIILLQVTRQLKTYTYGRPITFPYARSEYAWLYKCNWWHQNQKTILVNCMNIGMHHGVPMSLVYVPHLVFNSFWQNDD
jgi:hypothetical protein